MGQLPLRIIGLAVLGYALWLAVSVSLANAFVNPAPAAALKLRPAHAAANSRMAEMSLAGQIRPDRLAAAESYARRALLRDPTQARAYGVLAVVALARGDGRAGERLMVETSRWTRRELANQLFLIEMHVRRNDVPAALRHYAIALTVRPDAKEILFPVLIGAVREQHLVEPIADFLARGSGWRHELLFRIAGEAEPLGHVDRLLRSVRGRNGTVELDVVRVLLARLVRDGAYRAAAQQATLATGGPHRLVRNGSFSSPSRMEPFDWTLANGASARSDIRGEADVGALAFEYMDAEPSVLARQLLVLPPGRYRLATRFELESGAVRREGPAWTLRCVDGPRLARLPLTSGAGAPVAHFQVPAGCHAQWLELGNSGETGTVWVSGTVRSVAVEPAVRN